MKMFLSFIYFVASICSKYQATLFFLVQAFKIIKTVKSRDFIKVNILLTRLLTFNFYLKFHSRTRFKYFYFPKPVATELSFLKLKHFIEPKLFFILLFCF